MKIFEKTKNGFKAVGGWICRHKEGIISGATGVAIGAGAVIGSQKLKAKHPSEEEEEDPSEDVEPSEE